MTTPNIRHICTTCIYTNAPRSIIKSMGLSIADFNTITRRLAQDPQLRQRVLKQAYLYRLEAKINDKCVAWCMCLLSCVCVDIHHSTNDRRAAITP